MANKADGRQARTVVNPAFRISTFRFRVSFTLLALSKVEAAVPAVAHGACRNGWLSTARTATSDLSFGWDAATLSSERCLGRVR